MSIVPISDSGMYENVGRTIGHHMYENVGRTIGHHMYENVGRAIGEGHTCREHP
jgi:hypothetical protein